MGLRSFLCLIILGTLLGWVAFILVLTRIDPTAGGVFRFFLFYASLWISILGTASVLGFFIRNKARRDPVIVRIAMTSFRQSLWISLLIIGLLLLQSIRYLRWWNALLIVVFFVGFELFYLASAKRPVQSPKEE